MGSGRRTWSLVPCLFLLILSRVLSYEYKVGDLDAWNIPSPSNPNVYTYWANNHNLTIGDSLLFLYPPSQDSVIQVNGQSYNSCSIKDPILLMNDGNSLFNITKDGVFYFTSGVSGHCEKHQKLRISVGGNGSFSDDPAAPSPSYPTVFGSIPMAPSSPLTSSSSAAATSSSSWLILSAAIACLTLTR
ncbi:mavicyanin [Impatiens glandulifera]|uniref:mavicyanin n=1 Tax=Impatiens glandulifera TaxID=253017 RepID=UPI001FB066BF|nr:mavicyanin [Impatiens glandulifera]